MLPTHAIVVHEPGGASPLLPPLPHLVVPERLLIRPDAHKRRRTPLQRKWHCGYCGGTLFTARRCALGLVEQLHDCLHRNKEPPRLVRERSKLEMPVEMRGLFVNRIDNHSRSRNLG